MKSEFRKRQSEYRIREQLPNGQKVNLYFKRTRSENNINQWHVGLYIGERKEANKWFTTITRNKYHPIKGDGSITALRLALNHIINFVNTMGYRDELVVGWADDKRKRAYQYLRRFGFIEYFDEKGNFTSLGIRNPKYWQYEEN